MSDNVAAFRHRNFSLYWTAQLISLMGTFMQSVALGYLVYDLTGSKWLLGVISALQMGPSIFLSLPAGVLADRVPRQKLVLVTQTSALLLAFCLATLTALHRLQVWEILLISTLSGIAIAIESPARQAFVVQLVGKKDLPNAIAWNSMVMNGGRVLGPAVGGIMIRYVGIAPVFYYNSLSFAAMIVALLLMDLPGSATAGERHPLADLSGGLRYLRHMPAVLFILGLLGVVAIFAMNFTVLMPIMARDVLHVGSEGLGWMWTAFGIGAVAGSLTVVRWSRAAVGGTLLVTTAVAAGLSEIALAASHTIPLALAALVLAGWSTAAFVAGCNSAVQDRVSDAVRGRVLSVYAMIFAGSAPLGGLIAAGLASIGGASLSFAVGGGMCVLFAAVAWPAMRSRLGRNEPATTYRPETGSQTPAQPTAGEHTLSSAEASASAGPGRTA